MGSPKSKPLPRGRTKGSKNSGNPPPAVIPPVKAEVESAVTRTSAALAGLVLDTYPSVIVRDKNGRVLGHALDWRVISVGEVTAVFQGMSVVAKSLDSLGVGNITETPNEIDDRVDSALRLALSVFWKPLEGTVLSQSNMRDLIMRWLSTVDTPGAVVSENPM